MTISKDCAPVPVEDLDIVGYIGGGRFVLLQAIKSGGRKLPEIPEIFMRVPEAIPAEVKNNQIINFGGSVSTLHDINGEWFQKRDTGEMVKLNGFTFFEIGNCR